MSGKSSRTKGHNYERQVRKELIALGWKNCETTRNANRLLDAAKVDLVNTDPFNIQCKAQENAIRYQLILDQMPTDNNYNIIFHKRNRKQLVVLSKNDFYELIQILKTHQII